MEQDVTFASPCYIKEYPLVIARGERAMVEDVDGNRFLDFMAGIAVASTGYGHPKVIAAIKAQADKFLHICGSDFYFEGMANLFERLAKLAPGPSRKRVFLSNSGAEAVDGAIKLARNSTRRAGLIAFKGAFHGRTYGAMSLTSSKVKQHAGFGPMLSEVYHVQYANPYRCECGQAHADCHLHSIAAIEELFARQVDPRDVAGDLRGADSGRGRLHRAAAAVPSRAARALRQARDSARVRRDPVRRRPHGEDVGDGVRGHRARHPAHREGARLGHAARRHHREGLDHEVGERRARLDVRRQSRSRARRRWRRSMSSSRSCCPRCPRSGERLIGAMRELQKKHPSIGDVRGKGLMIGVEFVKDRATREPAPELARALVDKAFEEGLLLLTCGKSTLRLAPPLVIDEQDIDIAVAIIDRALTSLT